MEYVISLHDVWRFLRRHLARIAAAVVIAVVVIMVGTFLWPPTYEATSLLLVKFGREYVYRPAVGDRDVALNRDRDTFINTELQILRSQDLIRSVVASMGVNALYPALSQGAAPTDPVIIGAAAASFSGNLVAERVIESDVIRLAFRHTDPKVAARALNQLIDSFKEKHLAAYSDPKAVAFLEEKVAQYRDELTKVEENLKALQLDTKSFSMDDQRANLFQQQREVETGLKDARNRIAGLQEKLTYLRSEKEAAAADPGRVASEQNKPIADARAQLLELELQEQKLLATFNETSRQVVGVRKQIEIVKDFLERQKAAIGQGAFAEDLDRQIVAAVAELRFQEARRDSLIGQTWQIEKELGRLPGRDSEYRDLMRQRESSEKTYETYLKKLEEARVSVDMDREKIANISVIQEALAPLAPIWPSKTLNLLVAILLGGFIGVGWGLALELLAARAREADEVALQTTVVSSEPAKLLRAGGDRA